LQKKFNLIGRANLVKISRAIQSVAKKNAVKKMREIKLEEKMKKTEIVPIKVKTKKKS